ncbi:inositol monophosphatase family protein [uncultured Corynebacterium sp.]|uniref:inositol monophosphatase family protein n=1 Tax=uncultured Corynebacterium sp. TaxID=159447 RepID=UPI0025D91B2C|nr:inositol monophosphatase family protein [uncultured Corynebacterium sp.]
MTDAQRPDVSTTDVSSTDLSTTDVPATDGNDQDVLGFTDAELASHVVCRAADLAARMRAEGLETEFKTSISDVVTAADRAAEQLVVSELARLRPADGILGEEGSAKEGTSGRTWVIDPVDGTYNFTSGSDYWCSAIALVEGSPDAPDRVILGAVHRTAGNVTWVGGPDLPTARTDARGTVELPRMGDAAAAEISVGTYLHSTWLDDDSLVAPWLAAAGKFATWRMLGSASVDLAGVAEGRIGAWFQHSVASWDWLPGHALVAGVGGASALVDGWRIAGPPSVVDELAGSLRR